MGNGKIKKKKKLM